MPLRVMTYNILNGGEGREDSILKVIQAVNPDLVLLQEVYTSQFLQSVSQSLGMDYSLGAGNKQRKVALLSRLPVRSFHSYHPFFPIWRNFVDAEIEYEPNKTMRVIGVHPIANLGLAFEIWRFWEARYIIRHSQNFQNMPCLIAGDFNAIAPKDKIRTETMPAWLKWIIFLQGNRVYRFSIPAFLSAGFTDCFRFLHPNDDGFTLPPPDPNTRLDYILVNAAMQACLKKCWVMREYQDVDMASDHYPVVAEFDLGDHQ